MMRCWQCGVEPFEVFDVRTFDDPDPVYIAGRWPPSTDHEHAEAPPTPAALSAAGDRITSRLTAIWGS